jgi:hypothetical protein
MPASNAGQAERIHWAWSIAGLIFAAGVTSVSHQVWHVSPRLILLAALLLVAFRYRSLALVLALFFVDWLGRIPFGSDPVRYTAMVTAVLLLMGHGPSSLARALTLPAAAAWFLITIGVPGGYSTFGWIVLGSSAVALVMFAVGWRKLPSAPRHVDVVVNSASGNTMHFAQSFIDGVRAAGAAVTVHRFHYFRDFQARLDGDALAVAFPVYGFKPPWPFLVWLLRYLPNGRGRPAFVLYSCAIGAENAGLLV